MTIQRKMERGVRDYIHVVDLANGHVKALEKVLSTTGLDAYNLGTGMGYSVLEMVEAFEKVSGKKVHIKLQSVAQVMWRYVLLMHRKQSVN